MTLKISTLREQRDNHLTAIRTLAAKAESESRGFTNAEQKLVDADFAKATEYRDQIKRIKGLQETNDLVFGYEAGPGNVQDST